MTDNQSARRSRSRQRARTAVDPPLQRAFCNTLSSPDTQPEIRVGVHASASSQTQRLLPLPLSAARLIPAVALQQACINPGRVISQQPAAGTHVPAGATTRITVDTATPRTCNTK